MDQRSDHHPTLPGSLFWLPSATFVLHTLEELPGFASWVTRHFAPMSDREFALLHIPLIWLVLWISWRASVRDSSTAWRFWACAAQWQFAFNAVFHLGASAWFGDYSPGMVTAATVALPATAVLTISCLRAGCLTRTRALLAASVGALLAATAIGFLFV